MEHQEDQEVALAVENNETTEATVRVRVQLKGVVLMRSLRSRVNSAKDRTVTYAQRDSELRSTRMTPVNVPKKQELTHEYYRDKDSESPWCFSKDLGIVT